MTKSERAEVLVMFTGGYMNWEIEKEMNLPIKEIRETVSRACGYDPEIYAMHINTSREHKFGLTRQGAELLVRRIWG